MKRFFLTLVFVTVCVFTLNSRETEEVDLKDQEAYCKEFADRGAETEWGQGETDTFEEYYNSYVAWYELCMEVHS